MIRKKEEAHGVFVGGSLVDVCTRIIIIAYVIFLGNLKEILVLV